MILLLSVFWPGLAGAMLLGLLVGGLAGFPARAAPPIALCLTAALLAGIAAAGLVPGTAGLWLDAAALILPPYLAGCALGALARRLAARG